MRDCDDEDHHRNELHHDERAVDAGRFANPDCDEQRHGEGHDRGNQIDLRMQRVNVGRLRPRRQDEADVTDEVLKVIGERRRRRRERKPVLEN